MEPDLDAAHAARADPVATTAPATCARNSRRVLMLLRKSVIRGDPEVATLARTNVADPREGKMPTGDPIVSVCRHPEYAQALFDRGLRVRIERAPKRGIR